MIAERIGLKVSIIGHDMYYKDLSHMTIEEREKQNFDHPDAFDNELFFNQLSMLKQGKGINAPTYDYVTHTRSGEHVFINVSDTVLLEGIMLFTDRKIRNLLDHKVFLEVDSDIRFIRRLQRDMDERGRSQNSVVSQYLDTVRPMHIKFVEPSKRFADVIIPGGGHNLVAIDLLATKIRTLLDNDF